MTAALSAGASSRRGQPAGDVVDAEYEVVMPAGPAPARAPEQAAPEVSAVGGMEMLRKVAAESTPRRAGRGGPLFWSGGIGLALAAFWISGGHVLMRMSALPAGPQAARAAFSVAAVSSRFDVSGPKPVLLVDGEAANDGAEAGELPPLEIRVAASDGSVTRYTLGTSGRTLGPGQRFAFSSRLGVPKNGVGSVSVMFTE